MMAVIAIVSINKFLTKIAKQGIRIFKSKTNRNIMQACFLKSVHYMGCIYLSFATGQFFFPFENQDIPTVAKIQQINKTKKSVDSLFLSFHLGRPEALPLIEVPDIAPGNGEI